jgi:hypothetical protein
LPGDTSCGPASTEAMPTQESALSNERDSIASELHSRPRGTRASRPRCCFSSSPAVSRSRAVPHQGRPSGPVFVEACVSDIGSRRSSFCGACLEPSTPTRIPRIDPHEAVVGGGVAEGTAAAAGVGVSGSASLVARLQARAQTGLKSIQTNPPEQRVTSSSVADRRERPRREARISAATWPRSGRRGNPRARPAPVESGGGDGHEGHHRRTGEKHAARV